MKCWRIKNLKRVLWYLIAGTRGGETRARIISLLRDRPYNANQLTEALSMDYKTIRHHLKVLEKNGVITSEGERYGLLYFLTDRMEANMPEFEKIWEKIEKP